MTWTRGNNAHYFPELYQCSAFAASLRSFCLAHLPAICFELSARTGSPGRSQGGPALTRVKGRQCSWVGRAAVPTLAAFRPGCHMHSSPMLPSHPATLPVTQCLHVLCPSYLSPLISVCFSGLWPLCRPKLQVLSVLLSSSPLCPGHLNRLSTPHKQNETKRERQFHLVNWVG